jgi:hypothetical protein
LCPFYVTFGLTTRQRVSLLGRRSVVILEIGTILNLCSPLLGMAVVARSRVSGMTLLGGPRGVRNPPWRGRPPPPCDRHPPAPPPLGPENPLWPEGQFERVSEGHCPLSTRSPDPAELRPVSLRSLHPPAHPPHPWFFSPPPPPFALARGVEKSLEGGGARKQP